MDDRPLVVVMGVSGVGKSTVGRVLARRLAVPYADGDDLHPEANIAKMAAGRPLTDEDRLPWLEAVGHWLAQHDERGGVMSCSALKRSYRDVLRVAAPRTYYLHLTGDSELIGSRIRHRDDHFMPASLLESQQQTLEPLQPDESGTAIDIAADVDAIVDDFLNRDK